MPSNPGSLGPSKRLGLPLLLIIGAVLGVFAPAAVARDLFVSGGAGIDVVDAQSNAITKEVAGSEPFELAVTPDGSRVYGVDTLDDAVSVFDTKTESFVATIPVPKFPEGIAITPDGKAVYVGSSNSGRISVIDTATNQVTGTIFKPGFAPEAIVFSPDGTRAYVANGGIGDDVTIIDTRSKAVIGTVPVNDRPEGIAISPNGALLYVAGTIDGGVSVIDAATATLIKTIPVGESPTAVAVAPDGSRAYASNRDSGTVSVIDAASNQVVGTVEVGTRPKDIAITPDGSRVYVSSENNGVAIIDAQTNQLVGHIDVPFTTAGIAVASTVPRAGLAGIAGRIRPGVPVSLEASSETFVSGTTLYSWSFGDGSTATDSGPLQSHSFAQPGQFQVSVVAGDAGSLPSQPVTEALTVSYPTVEVRCPRAAGKQGCTYKLRVVARAKAKHRKGKHAKQKLLSQSALAKVRIKRGQAQLVPLVPNQPFAAALAPATTLLVHEAVVVGAKHHQAVKRLAVVG
jgi:YVTN family beta-propeller protein